MPPLSLNWEWLKVQPTATHLGHTVGNNNINNIAVCKVTRYIVWRTNYWVNVVFVIQIYDHSF